MKNYLSLVFICLLGLAASSQTKEHKAGISIGGGFQNYKGDLGNAFKFKNETSYGSVNFQAAYYLSRSFDAGLFGSLGDLGYCQPPGKGDEEVAPELRCPGCDRPGLGNLNSRLFTGGGFIKYKFSNNYILSENAKLKPYVYAGAAINNVTDIMRMNCVNPGIYFSLNGGAGFKYYVTERFNIGYNFSLGYFTSDKVDFMYHGRSNDLYMQNSITFGIDLF